MASTPLYQFTQPMQIGRYQPSAGLLARMPTAHAARLEAAGIVRRVFGEPAAGQAIGSFSEEDFVLPPDPPPPPKPLSVADVLRRFKWPGVESIEAAQLLGFPKRSRARMSLDRRGEPVAENYYEVEHVELWERRLSDLRFERRR
jgi:hypothetical protein